MRNILREANHGALFELAQGKVLLAFDYDGTLAPIVGDPESAAMRPETRELLIALARIYPCAVISGRAQEDVVRRLRGVDLVGVMGNHGMEPWRRTELFAARARGWREILERELCELEGVKIEDKTFSLAIHYRSAARREAAKEAILKVAGTLQDARLVGGKEVVNVIPAGAPDKGEGLEWLRERVECERSLYVGDDETDEDAFALEDCGRVVGVRVERLEGSCASFYVPGQRHVDTLLRHLLEMRLPAKASARVKREEPAQGASRDEADAPDGLGNVLEVMRLMWSIDQGLHRTSKQMESTLGITAPQRLVIRLIGRFPGITMGRLAGLMLVHPSTVTGIVQRLSTRGLVERRVDRRDRRRAFLHVTPKGAEWNVDKGGTVETAVRRVLATTHSFKIQHTREVLTSLASALQHVNVTPVRTPPARRISDRQLAR